MILKSKTFFSAYNEYCEVSVEGAYINIKLIIGNREPATGSLFWYIILMFQKCKSGMRNQFPVPY